MHEFHLTHIRNLCDPHLCAFCLYVARHPMMIRTDEDTTQQKKEGSSSLRNPVLKCRTRSLPGRHDKAGLRAIVDATNHLYSSGSGPSHCYSLFPCSYQSFEVQVNSRHIICNYSNSKALLHEHCYKQQPHQVSDSDRYLLAPILSATCLLKVHKIQVRK